MKNPLLDKDFLRSLDQEKEREIYARVISLNFNEEPIEEISGRVTSGSINIDGNSAVRRTCSLSLVAEEMNIHDYYWGMNTKFTLMIGMKNNINPEYDDIIWFPQGMYLISSFNTSQSVNNYTISLQGKDKMVLLNGEVGGMITSLSHDFGTVDVQQEDGSYAIQHLTLKEIIRSAVHTFAKEPYHNIIINDLDDYGVELMEYRGDLPLYFLVDVNTQEVSNSRLGAKDKNGQSLDYYYQQYDPKEEKYSGKWSNTRINIEDERIVYDNRIDFLDLPVNPTLLMTYDTQGKEHVYTAIKITYGMTIGYRMTDLTYAGDLIIQVGGTITSMLDKIKAMLGEFEYFYDLDGHFVFQKKKTFLQTSWNNIKTNENSETYVDNVTESSAITYNFENASIVTAFANNPNLSNLKNDFSIWGVRKSATGSDIPIHLRYAVDKKPIYYKNYDGEVFANMTKTEEQIREEVIQEILNGVNTYQKKPNPNGLSEDWWEILDWGEYYKKLTGDYPPGSIGNYCKDYVRKGDIDLNSMFPPGNHWSFIDIYIFDVTYNYDDNDNLFLTLGYFGHGRGCSHPYSYFTDRADKGEGTSYIYKPTIPLQESSAGFEQNVQIKVDYLVTRYSQEWREIIYQMALDYYKHHEEDDFLLRIAENNTDPVTQESYYPNGVTGYEEYYTDIISFWRQLYNPDYVHSFEQVSITRGIYQDVNNAETYWTPVPCEATTEYFDSQDNNKPRQFLKKIEYQNYVPISFTDKSWGNTNDKTSYYYLKKLNKKTDAFDPAAVYYIEIDSEFDKDTNWSKLVVGNNDTQESPNPELLNFWFDFLDTTTGQMEQYSVHNVGNRPKAENDTGVKAIYFRDTPNVIVVNPATIKKEERMKILGAYGGVEKWEEAICKDYDIAVNDYISINMKKENIINTMADMRIAEIKALKPGYTIIRLNSTMENLFNISAQGKSAFDVLNSHLYNYAHCADTITITSLPVYYLNPNTRISVKDDNSKINGEYIINKITLPLQYSGTMSISATKAVENLF